MPKQDEQEFGAVFPVAGLDVTSEFARQPADTTADAVNVASFDTLADRCRGGSREGLNKFNPDRVVDATMVQHLCVLVDPQSPALRTDGDAGGAIADTSTVNPAINRVAGRFVRPGGSGRPSSVPTNPPAPGDIARIQLKSQGTDASADQRTMSFDAQPESTESVIVVIVLMLASAPGVEIDSITNANLNDYTQIGGYEEVEKVGSYLVASMWYKTASAGAADTDIRVTPGGSVTMLIVGIEYENMVTTGALDQVVTDFDDSASDPMSTGAIPVGGDNECVIAFFAGFLAPDTITLNEPPSDPRFTSIFEHGDGTVDNTDLQLYVYEILGVDFPDTPELNGSFDGGADDWIAFGASFEPE